MIEAILGFKALILAALIGGAYLIWRKSAVRRIREMEKREQKPCPPEAKEKTPRK